MAGGQKNQRYCQHDGYAQALYQNDFQFSLDEVEMCQQQDHLYQAQNDRKWKAVVLHNRSSSASQVVPFNSYGTH